MIANDDTATPVAAGSYQGATQNGNYVFFTLGANRAITGFKVNDLPGTCVPADTHIIGGIDLKYDVFYVNADGRFSFETTWSGSNDQGNYWPSFSPKVTGFFDNPTTVSGTLSWKGELVIKGVHHQCSSGDIRWSATRQS
jgi:hypothetical protein